MHTENLPGCQSAAEDNDSCELVVFYAFYVGEYTGRQLGRGARSDTGGADSRSQRHSASLEGLLRNASGFCFLANPAQVGPEPPPYTAISTAIWRLTL